MSGFEFGVAVVLYRWGTSNWRLLFNDISVFCSKLLMLPLWPVVMNANLVVRRKLLYCGSRSTPIRHHRSLPLP